MQTMQWPRVRILASTGTVESEWRQMKQCWILYLKYMKNTWKIHINLPVCNANECALIFLSLSLSPLFSSFNPFIHLKAYQICSLFFPSPHCSSLSLLSFSPSHTEFSSLILITQSLPTSPVLIPPPYAYWNSAFSPIVILPLSSLLLIT